MSNPTIVEVQRGGFVESEHRGAYAVVGANGRIIAQAGDIARPVYPRSAIKAFQALPLIESGAAEALGLTDEEIALACASHSGEAQHVRAARSILAKAKLDEGLLECGAHMPMNVESARTLVRNGEEARAIHNNCSGKHAGMLAVAARTGALPNGYVKRDHAVQRTVARIIDELCDVRTDELPFGIDGCSVPTWAVPLGKLALGFERFLSGETLAPARAAAARRIIGAVRAHPDMVAGTDRFCTRLMQAVPRAFVKTGAEGVFAGGVPHAGIGIAVKCDDGATRAAEVAMASLLASLDVWTPEERRALSAFSTVSLSNWRKIETGAVAATLPLGRTDP